MEKSKSESKASITLDDILFPKNTTTTNTFIDNGLENLNLNLNEKSSKNKPNGDSTTNINNKSKNETESGLNINNDIDHILNNGLIKFENKNQTSMYFVCCKSITSFYSELKSKYNINISKEFINKHIIENIPSIIKEYTSNLKKRCKKIVNTDMICLGRKLDSKQCTRKKHNGFDFCKSHLIKLSNGRMDQPNQVSIRNKRGRKRKVEFDPRQYDNEYVTLWEDIINGVKVLLDSNNNIYTYDFNAPRYLGKKMIDTNIDDFILKNDIINNDSKNSSGSENVIESIAIETNNIIENMNLDINTPIEQTPDIKIESKIIETKLNNKSVNKKLKPILKPITKNNKIIA